MKLVFSYNSAPSSWDARTASWVLVLYSRHRIHCYQTDAVTLLFECEQDVNFASIVITDAFKVT